MPTPIWEPSRNPSRVNLFIIIAYAKQIVNIHLFAYNIYYIEFT